jgi:hypothetical protein
MLRVTAYPPNQYPFTTQKRNFAELIKYATSQDIPELVEISWLGADPLESHVLYRGLTCRTTCEPFEALWFGQKHGQEMTAGCRRPLTRERRSRLPRVTGDQHCCHAESWYSDKLAPLSINTWIPSCSSLFFWRCRAATVIFNLHHTD